MLNITEILVTECLLKVQTFVESICGKCSARKWYMDGWINLPPKREKYYLLMK